MLPSKSIKTYVRFFIMIIIFSYLSKVANIIILIRQYFEFLHEVDLSVDKGGDLPIYHDSLSQPSSSHLRSHTTVLARARLQGITLDGIKRNIFLCCCPQTWICTNPSSEPSVIRQKSLQSTASTTIVKLHQEQSIKGLRLN